MFDTARISTVSLTNKTYCIVFTCELFLVTLFTWFFVVRYGVLSTFLLESFQEPASLFMHNVIIFHNDIVFFLIIILGYVFFILFYLYLKFVTFVPENRANTYYSVKCMQSIIDNKNLFNSYLNINHNMMLEIIWTLIPAFILVLIAIPSFILLYSSSNVTSFYYNDLIVTFKIIGRQWYWSYEYAFNKNNYVYASNIKTIDQYLDNDFNFHKKFLWSSDSIFLPVNVPIKILITSSDVIHSWSVPSFGVKVDACPGRLNQVFLVINRPGFFYGQCSEICGVYHGFMPIFIEVGNKY